MSGPGSARTEVRPGPAVSARSLELLPLLAGPPGSVEYQDAMFNILEDDAADRARLAATEKALVNMLADLDEEGTRVRQANEAMRSFVAIAAHDLRSPLASILGLSALLADGWERLDDQKRRKCARAIERQSHKLSALVSDLLTLSSAEGGSLVPHPESVELSGAIGQAVTQATVVADDGASAVSVSCRPDLLVRVDPVHLSRILGNYLSNAFKYGAPPVRVEVEELAGVVEVAVTDHGLGVPTAFVPRLFGRFARAEEPAARDQKGAGLGLSIAAGLAQVNGGRVSYRPAAGGGACFAVVLPATDGRST